MIEVYAEDVYGAQSNVVDFYIVVQEYEPPQNTCPEITPVLDQYVTAGDQVYVDVEVIDFENDSLTYTWDLGGSGATTTDNLLEWQTQPGDEGEYLITLDVDDGECTVQETFTIYVETANTCPTITGLIDAEIEEGDFFEVTAIVEDLDNDPVTLVWDVENSNGVGVGDTYSWQTQPGDEGDYIISLTADDGICQVEQAFELSVSAYTNNAPVIDEIEDIAVLEGEIVDVTANATDEESVTYVWDIGLTGATVTDDNFYWETQAGDQGIYTVEVYALDIFGEQSNIVDFTITVSEENLPPQLEMEDVEIDEGDYIEIIAEAVDPNGDFLTYTWEFNENMEGYTFNSNVFEWYTDCDDAGLYPITVYVTDGEFTVSDSFNLKVNDVLDCDLPTTDYEYTGGKLDVTSIKVMNAAHLASAFTIPEAWEVTATGDYYIEDNQLKSKNTDNEIIVELSLYNKNSFDAEDLRVSFVLEEKESNAYFGNLDRAERNSQLFRIDIPEDLSTGKYTLKVFVENEDLYQESYINLNIESLADVMGVEQTQIQETEPKSFWQSLWDLFS